MQAPLTGFLAGMGAAALIGVSVPPAWAADLRVATYNTELFRKGPGLLLRDIMEGDDPQVRAVVAVIAHMRPDILALQGIDYDLDGLAVQALAERISAQGLDLTYHFAHPPNTGLRTGLDMDGDGRTGGPRDAQGFGYFAGQGGIAILSRFPILEDEVREFSTMLWPDLPGATLPEDEGPFPSAEAQAIQRLSTTAHWDVPVKVGDTVLHLLTFHATPPVFDGPEDANGLRNRDELRLWSLYLDGALAGAVPPAAPFVVLGDANLDPEDGDGRSAAMRAFLNDPRLTDPKPTSDGATAASHLQGGANLDDRGDPALDTVDWDDAADGPGNLRVDYVLPSADLSVTGSGVFWPEGGELAETVARASRHRLVWVDIALP
ncbi:3-phytase precursor [Rhodovulum sp. P5]|uniref:endonuclease/exonuclease/phosphatase family protein n=1 Tax=Rhodovulum sp. P5 TaxID=1564506 RepID=UPI0009C1C619|nr:endonuclease/exonuclease/phosphatase family protein [Rhodovulum sp. P5]ARE41246.1 3-phytase precursor [Rhodovulum sp. P5]